MTPQEKVQQAEKIEPYIMSAATMWTRGHMNTLVHTKSYPSLYSFDKDFSNIGMGTWTIIVVAVNRQFTSKGMLKIFAYQKFLVDKAKNATNKGYGIWMIHLKTGKGVMFLEFSPHYFNRLRTRLLEPSGVTSKSFNDIVKTMLRETMGTMITSIKGYVYEKDEDGKYHYIPDHSLDREEGYDNMVGYHNGGLSLGVQTLEGVYRHFTTFVSNDLLSDDQAEKQKENMALTEKHRFRKNKNHYYSEKFYEEKYINNEDTTTDTQQDCIQQGL